MILLAGTTGEAPTTHLPEKQTLLREVGERGLTPCGQMFERYLVGPIHNPDATTWRTQVCCPIVVG